MSTLRKRVHEGSNLPEYLYDLMKEYGPVYHIFLMHRAIVMALDAPFHKEVFTTVAHIKPYSGYRYLSNVFGTRFMGNGLITETVPSKHAKRRALFSPAFHRKYLMSLMDQFNFSADVLVNRLTTIADGKTEVAMLDEFNRLTLDVIAKVAFDLRLNITEETESPFVKALTMTMQGIQNSFKAPWKEFSPLPSDRQYRHQVGEAITFLRETGRECVKRRLEAKRKGEDLPQDILTYILQASEDLEGDEDFKMEEMLDEFVSFFLAGQETTANTLAFALVELGHHPDVMHRLKTEAVAVMGDNDYVAYSDLGKLDYMMMVLKETLRLWPPAFSTSRDLGYDVEVRGYTVPAGTTVWLNAYVMGRNGEYFKNPLDFDPDRFKDNEDKTLYAYFPFSLGHRSCIGQPFALIEARVIMAKLLKKFDFELVPGQGFEILQELTLKPKGRSRNYITLAE
ncbi:cholesterol 24-hydroxylase-like isoform X2 [Patiria miniata]|nr:cholesterol 24-hydroxylase-like isoform X2 [Patiria miniata]